MTCPMITVDDLSDFTGRPAESFNSVFVMYSAIPQAVLLFKMATCIEDFEQLSEDNQNLVKFAIMAMVDDIALKAPFQAALASPFNSESIGSYSYSKSAAAAIKNGTETGVFWFDMAVRKLSVCDSLSVGGGGVGGNIQRGGIEMFEYDGTFTPGELSGNYAFVSPSS